MSRHIAALPGAAVPVPSGAAGLVWVVAVTGAVLVSLRWRWGRYGTAAALCCLLAWTVSGLVGAA